MPAIDHLVYAVPELQAGIAAVSALSGVEAAPGGAHPGAGTCNALLSFDDRAYFEIISVDPDQPDHVGPRPFEVDGEGPPRMASFAIHPLGDETIDSVADRMRGLGFDPGPVTAMSRRRPDGAEISWRLTRTVGSPLGLANPSGHGLVPFVIDWGSTPSPARSTPRIGRLAALSITHPEPAVVDLVNALDLQLTDGDVIVSIGDRSLAALVELADGRTVELI